jgi:hypothetical protein
MRPLIILCILVVWVSICKAQWIQTNNGLTSDEINGLFVDPGGTNLFAGTEGDGVFLSTNYGDSWSQVNDGLTNLLVYAFAMNSTYLFVGTDDRVFRSSNNGSNWEPVNNGLTNPFVQALAVSGTNLFAGTAYPGGAFLSTNNGDNWVAVDSGLTSDPIINLTVSGPNLFAGSVGHGVFLSTNNGNSWSQVNNGLTNDFILAFTVNGINLFAGTFEGAFHSTNNGSSWTHVGLTNYYVGAFVWSEGNLFAGAASNGVFLSSNNGGSWSDVTNGLGNYNVGSLAISGTYLFASTLYDGVWQRPLSEMITSVREIARNEMPSEYRIGTNYPNPFNPTTKIKYQIPELSFVTLKVFDVLGSEVATLVNEEKLIGNYEIEFDAQELTSGIYFYELQAGSFVETKKMVLMK